VNVRRSGTGASSHEHSLVHSRFLRLLTEGPIDGRTANSDMRRSGQRVAVDGPLRVISLPPTWDTQKPPTKAHFRTWYGLQAGYWTTHRDFTWSSFFYSARAFASVLRWAGAWQSAASPIALVLMLERPTRKFTTQIVRPGERVDPNTESAGFESMSLRIAQEKRTSKNPKEPTRPPA
jgi:hypothetical protein